ncbi:conserved hypothetical protein [Uncinocarpus reesii 1704]|uniref:DASH complex subunit DUO1 n=1 Tax=Uncinocarpus reesii (strain UAMH 1704) TaxID=336963 RepID=C4JYV7_UNCRE|nr:uncharacterized protein UREG_07358 [Uncinocarpus reesii 1704]EEP82493.1 conserved hypothetical protein [Uncinocarpus reesii 1704]
MTVPTDDMEKLHLEESSEGDFWNMSSKQRPKHSSGKFAEDASSNQGIPSSEEREVALRAELQMLRNINNVIEGTIDSLERAKDNMGNVSRTVDSASTLLDTWTRVLSQTEHNQRLILNPSWQGATQDIAKMENEAALKQQAAERRELEQQQRKEALARKAAEEERKKAEAAAATSRGLRGASSRGRTRVAGRNPSISSTAQTGQTSLRNQSRGTADAAPSSVRASGPPNADHNTHITILPTPPGVLRISLLSSMGR